MVSEQCLGVPRTRLASHKILGPGWPPISLPGLWTQAWNSGEGILGYYLGFKECYLVVGSVLSAFYDPAWSVTKPKTSSKVVD